jgi:hypothetical protein
VQRRDSTRARAFIAKYELNRDCPAASLRNDRRPHGRARRHHRSATDVAGGGAAGARCYSLWPASLGRTPRPCDQRVPILWHVRPFIGGPFDPGQIDRHVERVTSRLATQVLPTDQPEGCEGSQTSPSRHRSLPPPTDRTNELLRRIGPELMVRCCLTVPLRSCPLRVNLPRRARSALHGASPGHGRDERSARPLGRRPPDGGRTRELHSR